ncbi:7008_t:CDS:2 [Cetraspora pellucida]|uniref:7008_t:CDS:1 n=1 Tax=Cetraspora pellucida TaxID=1433469 RepID=A0ACA9N116_9GLOM|nr:7008_t:CDS:2 [Cetraspora pellucida]
MTFSIGRLVHYAADAVLVSAVLAGIKRSTGLTLATHRIENEEVRNAVNKFLGVGEWVVDQGISYMSSSPYFERKR